MPDLVPLLAFLVLGVLVAFLRARNAQARVSHLEAQMMAMDHRLQGLQEQIGRLHHGADGVRTPDDEEAASRPDIAGIPPVPPAANAPALTSTGEQPTPRPTLTAEEGPGEPRTSLEELIGGRWLLFAGVAAIVLGVSYFVKFAFDNGWISEPLRVAAGVIAGFLLIGGGVRFWSRGLPLFGQALAGAGLLVQYVSIYAALHFYALIPPAAAFALMGVVTAVAAWLSDRQRSQPLAALALVGGFATPLLVGGDRDAQVVLFTYMGILIGGAAVLARRHTWPLVGAASYLCTFVLVVSWFYSSYEGRHWARTEVFLTIYVVLFGYLLRAARRSSTRSPQAQLAAATLATAPLVYHLASMILLMPHPGAWLGYVVAATLAGLLAAQRMRAGPLRVVVLLIVGLPMTAWLEPLPYPRWYGPAVVTLFALYALHLAAQWEANGQEEDATGRLAGIVHTQLNGLLLPFSLYLFLLDRDASLNPWMTAALAVWNAGLAVVASTRAPRRRLEFIALAATLGAVAVVLEFDGPAVAFGWAAEGVLVGWLAARERSRTLGMGSALLIGLGILQLADLLAAPLPAGDLPILNARALATALVIALVAWLAWRIRDDPAPQARNWARVALIVAANLVALALISADLRAYFAQRAVDASIAGELRAVSDAGLAEQVALSVTWALYAVGLVFAGIRRRFPPARYLAIGLFGVVIVKVLAYDIAGLDRLYRMLSVLGVGVLLVVASYLYQRRSGDLSPALSAPDNGTRTP